MTDIETLIFKMLHQNPGLSDRELALLVNGQDKSTKYINQSCRAMAAQGLLFRKKRPDGLIGNWLSQEAEPSTTPAISVLIQSEEIVGKKMKQALDSFLSAHNWESDIKGSGNSKNDIEARRGNQRWVIKVKGAVAYDPNLIRHFLSGLGELLQRMDDPACKYSVALPDISPCRRMWERMPVLARERTGISALFVNSAGEVFESALN